MRLDWQGSARIDSRENEAADWKGMVSVRGFGPSTGAVEEWEEEGTLV